jgi:hypothetical protein
MVVKVSCKNFITTLQLLPTQENMVVKVSCKNVITTFQLLPTQKKKKKKKINGMIVKVSCIKDNTKKHNGFS